MDKVRKKAKTRAFHFIHFFLKSKKGENFITGGNHGF